MYQTIEFERLAALAPFVNNFHLERVIVNVAKQLRLQVGEICLFNMSVIVIIC